MVLAAILATTLFLFISGKREVRAQAVRERKRVDVLLDAMSQQLSAVAPTEREPLYVPVIMRSGLNVNNRIQALRLLRRGESAAHAAAALGVPACEIELLMRIQAAVSKAPAAFAQAASD
jgi:hypothetical protein